MTRPWSLAAAGRISRSFLLRIPLLSRQLGPVTSTSLLLASRISNSLRAGVPSRDFAVHRGSGVILVCVPEGPLSKVLKPEAVEWKGKTVLICDSPECGHTKALLRECGASVGSLNQLADLPDFFYAVGDRAAVRVAKTIVSSMKARALEISEDRLLLFQSALTLSGSLFTPLLETALECLRRAGLAQPEAARMTETLFQHSLSAFKYAGRKSWAGPVALADERTLRAQEQALRAAKPLMASYFHDAVRYSFSLYQTFPELTRYDKSRWHEFRKRYSP